MTRILFLGAGALGGYFGGRMTSGGADVTLLVRPARAKALAEGLRIESPLGDETVSVRTITKEDAPRPFDIIVLTNKAYGLVGALASIRPFIGDQTVIIPLLNGLAHYEAIDQELPGTIVLGGVAQIPAEMRADGSILHRGELQRIMVGRRANQQAGADKAEAFVAAAKKGGVQARVSDQIEQDLWDKWVFLTALAAGTCLMRTDVGAICRTTHGTMVMERLLAECLSVAKAEGHEPDEAQYRLYGGALLSPEGTFKSSMLVDMEAGNPTEADHILGDMIQCAGRHGVSVPTLETAYTRLQVYAAARG